MELLQKIKDIYEDADKNWNHGYGLLKYLDENNIKYEDDIIKIITPLGYAGTAAYFQKMGVPLSEGEMMKIMNEYIYDE